MIVAALVAIACLSSAGSAAAFNRGSENTLPWPYDTISYVDASAFGPSVDRAVDSWNRRSSGYRFVPARSEADANIVFVGAPTRSSPCVGSTVSGYGFGQSFVTIEGRCDRYIATLAAAHELGHVVSLGHEGDVCAVMNRQSLANRRVPRLARPLKCDRGPQYWRSPVQPDDRRGGQDARNRPFSLPPNFCYDADGFQSQLTADELLCNFQYECRGIEGNAPTGGDISLDAQLVQNGCERQAFDRDRVERTTGRAKAAHSDGGGDVPAPTFGQSPGVETFGR